MTAGTPGERRSRLRPIIGLTGLRGVGKSEAASHLVARFGFVRVHPFDGGKAAAAAYFMHLGASAADAESMVRGRLRDVPSPLLPDMVAPRLFLERLGEFMGQGLGAAWTLGGELDRLSRGGAVAPVVVESVVYEATEIHARGGVIVRIVRPGHRGPDGVASDGVQAAIAADVTIFNDGDLAELCDRVAAVASAVIGDG